MRASAGEYELAYEVMGAGRPVSVLHWGMFGDRAQLRSLAELLPGTRILFDGRAYGASDAPSTPYSLEDYAQELATAVRTVAPEPCVLIGQSMAGMTFLRLALAHPEMVAGLVLIDSSAAPEDPDLAPTYEALLAELIESGPSAQLLDFVAEASLMSPAFFAEQRDDVDRWREAMLTLDVDAFVAHARAVFDRTDVRDQLPGLHVPALVVVGALDTSTPPERARELCALLPDVRAYVEIPDAGHFAAWEKPRRTAEAVRRFLAEVAEG